VGEDSFSLGVSPRSEHLGVVETSVGTVGRALAGVGEEVCERVVGGLVLVVVSDITLVDNDEVGLALAVMAKRARTPVVAIETTRIANIEVEQRRVTGVRSLTVEW